MTDPIQINPLNTAYFGASWAGPELAAFGQDIYIVGKEQPEDKTGVSLFRSEDGGITFTQLDDVDWAIGDDLSRFPDVAAGPNGGVLVAFMRFDPDFSGARYVVSRSSDFGTTFQEDVNASSAIIDGEACDCCAAQLALSGDKAAMIYRNNDQNIRTIWAGLSEDGGETFIQGIEVDETQSYFASCPATAPHGYWADNRLISTFRAKPGGRDRVFFSVMDLDSQKVVLHQYLTNSPEMLLTQDHPRITGEQDTVFLIWEEAYAGNLDIKYRFSTDGPEGLVNAQAVTLNNQTTGNQLRPDAYWMNGRIHVVYQDNISKQIQYVVGTPSTSTALDKPIVQRELALFPNPTTGLVSISSDAGIVEIEVINAFGTVVSRLQSSTPLTQVDLSHLPDWIYTLHMYSQDQDRYLPERVFKIRQ